MKLLEPIKVGNIEFKNRIMFPPLTTGYEEKDGSIGEQSFRFYERLAKGGVGYIVIGDVAPLPTFSPTPKLYSPQQAEGFQRLADGLSSTRTLESLVYIIAECCQLVPLSTILIAEGQNFTMICSTL